jgi:hypothetical protein
LRDYLDEHFDVYQGSSVALEPEELELAELESGARTVH